MNLDQLRSFLKIAETANFRIAAERLHSTQPTVSARIKMLEEQLGRQLFVRAHSGVQLTAAGHRFRQYADMAVKAIERGKAEARLPEGVDRMVAVGVQNYLVHDLGMFLARESRQLAMRHVLRIEPDYSDALTGLVAKGMVDLALVYVPRLVADLEVEPVGRQDVVLVATPGCTPDQDKFAQDYIHVFWGDAFLPIEAETLGETRAPSLAVGSPRMALDIMLERGGAAYLDRRMVDLLVTRGQLQWVPDAPRFERTVYLVSQPQRRSLEVDALRSIIQRWFHD